MIARRCEDITLEIIELLFLANSKQNQSKLLILNKIDIKLKVLKILIRIAFEAKAMNQKNYLSLQESLQEIGRMLGGWIKSLRSSMRPKNPTL